MADPSKVIVQLGLQLAQAIVDKTIAQVELVELREQQAAAVEPAEGVGDLPEYDPALKGVVS